MPIPLCESPCEFSCPDGSYHNQESYFFGQPMPLNGCCGNNVQDTCLSDPPVGISQNPNKGGKKFRKQSGDWGGISFQCAETPFTSATGNKETSLGGGDDRAIGGRKKNYTCKCPYGSNFSGSTSYTITAHSSLRARRICSRYGKGCYLESSYGV